MAKDCHEAGGSIEDCVKAGLAALEACRYAAYCPPADDEDLVAALLTPVPFFLRGDATQDTLVDLGDAILIFRFLYGRRALTCPDAADANDDGWIQMADAMWLLRFLYLEGPELPEPTDEPGPDPTPDHLGCDGLYGYAS